MAVQIPTLNRTAVSGDPSVGRTEYQAPDTKTALSMQREALQGLGNKVVEAVQQEQKYTADTAALDAGVQYHRHLEDSLHGPEGAANSQGDPSVAYKEYDEKAQLKRQEILDKYKDASDLTRSTIQAKLQDTDNRFYDARTTAYGKQVADYTVRTTNSAVQISKDEMRNSVAHLNIHDPDTTIPLDRNIKEIMDNRINAGLKIGGVTKDKEGHYIISDQVKVQIKKDLNDGISKTIHSLSVAGDVDGAKFLSEKYAQHLTPDVKDKLNERLKKDEIDVKANLLFDKVKGMPDGDAAKIIDEQSGNPDVAKKAMANISTYRNQMARMGKNQATENYNTLGKVVMEKQQSGQPYADVNELTNDPRYKEMADKLTPKQLMAVQHMVVAPTDSDISVKNANYEKLFKGEFKGMSPGDFNESVAGLNKKDRNTMETQWRKENTETAGEEMRSVKYMGNELTKHMVQAGIVKKNDFGKFSTKDQNKLTASNDDMIAAMEQLPKNISIADKNAWVKKFVADHLKEGLAIPAAPTPKFKGAPERDVTPKKPTTSNVPGATPSALAPGQKTNLEYAKDFKAATGKWPDLKSNELQDFIKKGNK